VNVNRAISRLLLIFVLAYAVLGARQLYVALVAGPTLAANEHNPRALALVPFRGSILARDGAILARSSARGRYYPLGPAAAQVVGYASSRFGASGLEAAFDSALSARPRTSDPLGQAEALLRGRSLPDAIGGATVVTTLDPAVQATLYAGLAAYPRAAGVALDPRTGEVLALASVPSFDPNRLDSDFARIVADPASPLVDRATDGLYPPGSTFKIVTAAAALDDGVVSLASRFEDPGTLAVGSFLVHDDEGEATGEQDLTGAFALSSNVDFAQIALRLGAERWFDAVARFGFGAPLGFVLPTARDRLPARADVTPSVLAQLGFGQADLVVTPLRMALVVATIADGGNEPRPVLVRSLRGAGGEGMLAGPGTLATPVSSDVAAEVTQMMVAVVRRGTGRAAALDGVQVAGKTGTATIATGRSHAWFVAFAPADAPRIAVAIVVENAGYGGLVAAPIARRVIATALAHEPG
jgi:peptidoglycan glycosyltransferase